MRIKTAFGERTRSIKLKEPKRKYLLIFEGETTEAIYFDAIDKYKNIIGIDSLVELVPIMREHHERGMSNPQIMVENFQQSLDITAAEHIGVKTLVKWITDELMEYCDFMKYVGNRRIVASVLNEIASQFGHDSIPRDKIVVICKQIVDALLARLDKQFAWPEIVSYIADDIEFRHQITYDSSLDKVCFVIDRDRKSFKAAQYDKTLSLCRQHGYGFYLTNPCFEFWLLLHYPVTKALSNEQKQYLLDNRKWDGVNNTPRRTYAENLLREHLQGYSKSNYRVEKLIHHVKDAVKNEALFCEDEDGLKVKIGSRIGVLIKEMTTKTL